jgi:hypothetical protein
MKLARSDKVVGNFVRVDYDKHQSYDTSPCHRQLDITGSALTETMRRDPIVWSLASLDETVQTRGPLT